MNSLVIINGGLHAAFTQLPAVDVSAGQLTAGSLLMLCWGIRCFESTVLVTGCRSLLQQKENCIPKQLMLCTDFGGSLKKPKYVYFWSDETHPSSQQFQPSSLISDKLQKHNRITKMCCIKWNLLSSPSFSDHYSFPSPTLVFPPTLQKALTKISCPFPLQIRLT